MIKGICTNCKGPQQISDRSLRRFAQRKKPILCSCGAILWHPSHGWMGLKS